MQVNPSKSHSQIYLSIIILICSIDVTQTILLWLSRLNKRDITLILEKPGALATFYQSKLTILCR
jgi:hypothetical protein